MKLQTKYGKDTKTGEQKREVQLTKELAAVKVQHYTKIPRHK